MRPALCHMRRPLWNAKGLPRLARCRVYRPPWPLVAVLNNKMEDFAGLTPVRLRSAVEGLPRKVLQRLAKENDMKVRV